MWHPLVTMWTAPAIVRPDMTPLPNVKENVPSPNTGPVVSQPVIVISGRPAAVMPLLGHASVSQDTFPPLVRMIVLGIRMDKTVPQIAHACRTTQTVVILKQGAVHVWRVSKDRTVRWNVRTGRMEMGVPKGAAVGRNNCQSVGRGMAYVYAHLGTKASTALLPVLRGGTGRIAWDDVSVTLITPLVVTTRQDSANARVATRRATVKWQYLEHQAPPQSCYGRCWERSLGWYSLRASWASCCL